MVSLGKCPSCQRMTDHADLESITIGNKLTGPLYNGVSMICPICKTVLGVAFDPYSLKSDTVDDLLEALGQPRRKR